MDRCGCVQGLGWDSAPESVARAVGLADASTVIDGEVRWEAEYVLPPAQRSACGRDEEVGRIPSQQAGGGAVASKVISFDELQQMTHEQRRAHFAASVVFDPEHDEDPQIRAIFVRARGRAQLRLAEREKARSDGE